MERREGERKRGKSGSISISIWFDMEGISSSLYILPLLIACCSVKVTNHKSNFLD